MSIDIFWVIVMISWRWIVIRSVLLAVVFLSAMLIANCAHGDVWWYRSRNCFYVVRVPNYHAQRVVRAYNAAIIAQSRAYVRRQRVVRPTRSYRSKNIEGTSPFVYRGRARRRR